MASLRDLGLSEYEARAYRSLLDSGPTTAKELSRSSDVPMGRIYDVLNSLDSDGLVRTQTASRPKKYVAVEPEPALDRLLADRKRELTERAEQYESIVAELNRQLDAAEPVRDPFWTAAVGPEESVDLLVERLAAAEEEIVVVGSTPAGGVDLADAADRIVDVIERRLAAGVAVSMLLPRSFYDHIPEERGLAYERRLQPHEGFDYRLSEEVTTTFALVDDLEVCVGVPHPVGEGLFGLVAMTDPSFADEVRAAVEPQWAAAEAI
jgi:sugar-specific transcriptional regulator TrmB